MSRYSLGARSRALTRFGSAIAVNRPNRGPRTSEEPWPGSLVQNTHLVISSWNEPPRQGSGHRGWCLGSPGPSVIGRRTFTIARSAGAITSTPATRTKAWFRHGHEGLEVKSHGGATYEVCRANEVPRRRFRASGHENAHRKVPVAGHRVHRVAHTSALGGMVMEGAR